MRQPEPIHCRPVEILQDLIRFDTTNPPGNEAPCIAYIDRLLSDAGIETTILALDEARPNLVARIKGRGDAPPLLLYGHVDVVTTAEQTWTHPPFSGEIVGGWVWGRGTLDMKGAVAMFLAAFLRAHSERASLPGDVILAAVSDEEHLGLYGVDYLVREHPGLFEGVRYALGEGGGFSVDMAGRRFYPIMVAEKQCCWLKATLRGPGGHGSMPIRGGAMARLAHLLRQLDRHRLPVHITPPTRLMIEAIARELPPLKGFAVRQLLNPVFTDRVLDLMGEESRLLDALLHNTASPTIVRGGYKTNVIPSEVSVELDGRLLPGFAPDDLLRELRELVGDEVEFEISSFDPCPPSADMGMFDTLAGILREADPAGAPIPHMLAGVTDARLFARLGIQTYGFTPMQFPPGFDHVSLVHGADERIPVDALRFGAEAVYQALLRFHA